MCEHTVIIFIVGFLRAPLCALVPSSLGQSAKAPKSVRASARGLLDPGTVY